MKVTLHFLLCLRGILNDARNFQEIWTKLKRAHGKFVSGAKALAACQVSRSQEEFIVNYMKTRRGFNLAGKQLSTKTQIQSTEECFSRMVNRNVILVYFCTTDNPVHMLPLLDLSRLIHMIVALER